MMDIKALVKRIGIERILKIAGCLLVVLVLFFGVKGMLARVVLVLGIALIYFDAWIVGKILKV